MKNLILALALALPACASVGHLGGHASPCLTSITSARTADEVTAALQGMGVQKELAVKTTEALMTSRITPKQVCDSLKR